jgi:hypothetical protein
MSSQFGYHQSGQKNEANASIMPWMSHTGCPRYRVSQTYVRKDTLKYTEGSKNNIPCCALSPRADGARNIACLRSHDVYSNQAFDEASLPGLRSPAF